MKKLSFLALLALVAGCTESPPATDTATATPAGETTEADTPSAEEKPEIEPTDGIYLVDHYDPERDVAADMEAAISAAGQLNKRILLEVGGQW